MNNQRIGVAGCGRMGLPMLRALRRAGFDATGFDIRPASEFTGEAMQLDPQDFAAPLNILFTVVRDIAQTEALLFTTQAVLQNAPALTHLVICSTLSPNCTRDLLARVPDHIHLIDAPMSGAAIGAVERRLSFMLGGDTGDLDHIQPLLDAMGTQFHRMGGFGMGMAAKVLNNMVAASSTVTTRLALDWAAQQGLDQEKLLALMGTSSGQTWFGSGFEQIEFARDGYGTDNSIGILKKDVQSAVDAAPQGADLSLPNAIIDAVARLKSIG